MLGYRFAGSLFLHSVGPFLVQFFMSGMIAWKLAHAVSFRSQFNRTSSHDVIETLENQQQNAAAGLFSRQSNTFKALFLISSQERRMTVMQFLIVAQFFVCYSLLSVLDIMDNVHIIGGANKHSWCWIYLVDLSNALVIANSALRIFVYYAFGGPFQRHLCSLFCSSFMRNPNSESETLMRSYPLKCSGNSENDRIAKLMTRESPIFQPEWIWTCFIDIFFLFLQMQIIYFYDQEFKMTNRRA